MAQFSLPNAGQIAFRRTLYRLLLIQAGLLALAVVAALLHQGMHYAVAALYGGAASIAGALVNGWRLQRITDRLGASDANPLETPQLAEFYKAAVLRLIVIVALLALGMGVLDMEALGILIGFIAAQLGYFFARPLRAR